MSKKQIASRFLWIKRWQSLGLHYVTISACFVLFLCLFYGNSLWQLWQYPQEQHWLDYFHNAYFRHILWFSFFQAFLSAIISLILGLLTARAFYYQTFKGKSLILKLFSLTMVLPALVAIFGVMGIYGNSGWLSDLVQLTGSNWKSNIYGLRGILIAHVFFNLPLASKIFLQTLHSIPPEQRQLAAQLNITGFTFFRLLEWPYLRRQLLSVFALVFMLCFTSFTIVLTMGGGPKYTTLEVAIYQAVTFDFELGKAAFLALLQFVICFLLFQISHYFNTHTDTRQHQKSCWFMPPTKLSNYFQRLLLILVIAFVTLPLLSVVISGLSLEAWEQSLKNPQLWSAFAYSLLIAPTAGALSLVMTFALLLGARQCFWNGFVGLSQQFINFGMLVLAIPTLVLAVGLFLWLRQLESHLLYLFIIVVFCNALAAMPFTIRLLATPLQDNMTYYDKLCQSLGIRGWQRLKLIEWHTLKRPVRSAFALATALSLGDFTAIALFGNQHFTSLPRLLYQQLGHYRSQEAAVTALILLIFCAIIFLIIEKNTNDSSTKRSI